MTGSWDSINFQFSIFNSQLKTLPMKNHKTAFFFILLFALLGISPALANEPAYLITYGSEAKTVEGDNDFLQIIFIRIPEDSASDRAYIRIFDADCGGRLDDKYSGKWDTRTRFRVFGGKGAWSTPKLKIPFPDKADLSAGKLLAEAEFGEDPFRDYQWHTFAHLRAEDGEKVGAFRYFRIVVEGRGGNDGNTYLIALSDDSQRNVSPKGAETFNFTPTVRLKKRDAFAELRFFVPKDDQEILVHNFDLPRSEIGVDTAFRENLPVEPAGQDEWKKTAVSLNENEAGRVAAVRFQGGKEMPNDGTFYVSDPKGRLLPIQMPVYLVQKQNLRPEPQISFEAMTDCSPVIFDGSRTVDPEGDALRFFWNFGDGNTGEGVRVSHRYESPGTYNASVVIEDDCGRVNNSILHQFTVTVNHPPVADAGPDRVAAPGEKLEFDGSGSADPDGEVVNYYWDFGDGTRAQGITARRTFKRPNLYIVTLRVEDNSGSPCKFSEDQCEILVNAAPVVDIGADRIASVGEELQFSGANSRDSDGKIIAYEWGMGDGTKKEGAEIVHVYKTPGTYDVTLTITDDSGVKNKFGKDSLKVFVNEPPVADAGDDLRGAIGNPVAFDGSGSLDRDGKLIAFMWDFGDGTPPAWVEIQNGKFETVTHRYEKPGQYRAVLTVKDNSGSSTDMAEDDALVVINDPPVASAGTDQWVTNSAVTFDAAASYDPDGKITKYLWDFGDGSKGSGPSPVHVYESPGVYTVRLTVKDDSGTSSERTSDEMTVTVNHLPFADAGPDRLGIPGQTFSFDASASFDPDGDIREIQWDFGDGLTPETRNSKLETVTRTYEKPGKYKVGLTVYDNSGHEEARGFDEAEIIINAPPVPLADCQQLKKDTSHASRLTPHVSRLTPHASRLTPHVSRFTSHCIISPGDIVHLDGSRSYDPDGNIVSYQWEVFRDAKFESRSNDMKSPAADFQLSEPGIYTAVLTVIDNRRLENSAAQTQMAIRVNHQPMADAGKNIHTNERKVLLDASASSDADGDPLVYQWDFGDNTPPVIGKTVVHLYSKGGNYPVILTADDGTGTGNARSTSSIRVKINEAPIADAGGDRTVCAGKIAIFDGSASADPEGGLMKYHWDFGDGVSAEGMNPTHIYDKGGTYPAILTVTDDSGLPGGDSSIDQITVKVIESPVADAGPDQTACAGEIVRFDGTKSRDLDGLVNNFEWHFGDGNVGGGPTPIHVYPKAGVYRVRLMITGDYTGDCDNTDDDEMIVTVYEAPHAKFTCPAAAEIGKTVQFEGELSPVTADFQSATDNQQPATSNQQPATHTPHPTNIVKWQWDFGDGTVADGKTAAHIFEKSGDYVVTLTVVSDADTNCNKMSLQKRIAINAPPTAVAGDDCFAGVNQVIIFDGSQSKDPDGVISSYIWNFGDGETGSGVQVRHQYKKPGEYEALLKVTDNSDLSNNSATDTRLVIVNDAPEPVIRWQVAGRRGQGAGAEELRIPVCAGEEILLSAAESFDPDGEIVSNHWLFGDGSPAEEGVTVRHAWHFPGTYPLVLTVDDGKGVSNSRTQISALVVVNIRPIADAGHNRMVSPGEEILFDASASKDPDGSLISFQWDFGDGETLQSNAEDPRAAHRYEKPGQYQVRLFVTDDSGTGCNTAEDAVNVRVNAPPVPDAGGNREGFSGGANDGLIFDASNSHDPDGDSLTFLWDFGDGETAQGQKVRHKFRTPGQYAVKLKVDDGTGLTSGIQWDEITVRIRKRGENPE
jgi:PKD repeat protein